MNNDVKQFFSKMDYRIFVFSLLFLVVGFIAGMQVTTVKEGRSSDNTTQKPVSPAPDSDVGENGRKVIDEGTIDGGGSFKTEIIDPSEVPEGQGEGQIQDKKAEDYKK
ncbi:MAG: hypothetical protein LBM95_08190 [Lactobacillales bacterium]|jgi:hypothetical protein|nr:hypothetical protein [Lactobacillales bacterium]